MDLNVAQRGIDAVAAELGVASVAAGEIYSQPSERQKGSNADSDSENWAA